MKSIKPFFNRLALLAVMITMAACGQMDNRAESSIGSTDNSVASKTEMFGGSITEKAELSEAELALRSDHMCSQVHPQFGAVIEQVTSAYNSNVAMKAGDNSMLALYPAGHPDAPQFGDDGAGVAVLVCQDPRLSAYSYIRTVILHEGLIIALKEASAAVTLYANDPENIDNALDKLAALAQVGRFGETVSDADMTSLEQDAARYAKFSRTFDSTLAFVIYHELGHSSMGHAMQTITGASGLNRTVDASNEIQADLFAGSAMTASGYSISGSGVVFSILERISPDGSVNHPASQERESMIERMNLHGAKKLLAPYAYFHRDR